MWECLFFFPPFFVCFDSLSRCTTVTPQWSVRSNVQVMMLMEIKWSYHLMITKFINQLYCLLMGRNYIIIHSFSWDLLVFSELHSKPWRYSIPQRTKEPTHIHYRSWNQKCAFKKILKTLSNYLIMKIVVNYLMTE